MIEAKDKALSKAKIGILHAKKNVFIATIIFSLRYRWATAADNCPTAWVDGTTICLNEEFFMGLKPEQQITLVAHEAWHVAFLHVIRCKAFKLNHKRYNKAADHVINLMLKDAGFMAIDKWLCDPQYTNMHTKEVYDLLPADTGSGNQPNPMGDDLQPGNDKGNGDGGDSNGEDTEIAVRKILAKAVAAQATSSSKGAGSLPGEIEVGLEKLLHPKVPWETLLLQFMDSMAKDDYSLARPNWYYQPEIIPSLFSESLGHIASAMDLSYSVSDKEVQEILGNLDYINRQLAPKEMTIAGFDTQIGTVHNITPDISVADLKFKGRGGTDLQCVFDYYADKKPQVLIIFSDLYCTKITVDPGYPVIWICINNPSAKVDFGRLIHYETDK